MKLNAQNKLMTNELMWAPDTNRWTQIHDFQKIINEKYELNIDNYHDLYKWSCDNYPEFWGEFWHYSEIVHSKTYDEVIDRTKRIDDIPEWFPGSRLNYAENLLRFKGDKIALYATGEGKMEVETRTFEQLRCRVVKYAAAMKFLGIKSGDRVVGYVPNCIETVEAMLAAASLGAIWSATSPDFGVMGVLERFSQIQPKLIFSVAAVVYNGKQHNHLEKLHQVVQALPDLSRVVIIPFVSGDRESTDISAIRNGIWLDEFLQLSSKDKCSSIYPTPEYAQLPFNHPLYIMYSSGTTGAPKCLVHSAGGTLIQHLKEHVLQGDLKSNDVLMYYTTTGWMMWNWMISALAVGTSIVLYDGSPLTPNANVLWDLVDKLNVTVLGTGAKWLAVLEEKGIRPMETHSLSSLHTILSTGSPLVPNSYSYVYNHVKKNVMLSSISVHCILENVIWMVARQSAVIYTSLVKQSAATSMLFQCGLQHFALQVMSRLLKYVNGGTDIVGCFMGQNPTLPVYKGEVQSRNLAVAVECWGGEDMPMLGESGELVCTKPHPSMPVYFWNDPEYSKYKNSYFSKYKGVWNHGDFCLINPDTGGLIMLGRSDGTLNPNGVRFGSAEIYTIVEAFKEIEDSLCVGQRGSNGDERVILFIKMVPGHKFDEALKKRIQVTIRTELSARHIPAIILEAKDIPYTISGKKVEVAVRDVIEGKTVKHIGAFRNPESLDLYRNIAELKSY